MARIGDYIQPGLNTYDPSPYLQAQQRATAVIGDSMAAGIGAVGDAIQDRKIKKDTVKTSKELAKAMAVLYPESAGALEPVIAQLDDEEMPLSERAALGAQIGEFINMGVQKSRDNALMNLQTQQLGLDERRVRIAEAMPQMEAQASQLAAMSENDIQLSDAQSRFSAIAEMEAPLTEKLPDMSGTRDLIAKYLGEGDGQKALNAVESYEKARIKQMEPLMGPEAGLRLTEIPDVDATGQPINRSVFVNPQGDVFDLNRQPLNQIAPVDGSVLPPRDDVQQERRIQPMPRTGLGIRPAGPVVTPTQQALDETKLKLAEQELKGAESAVAKEQSTKQASLANAEDAVKLIDTLKKHPGFEAAVGSGFSKTVLRQDEPIRGTERAGAVAIIDQLKGQAFLNAIQQLRGLGALSDAEGAKLQQAAARLDPNQGEKDFNAALEEYKTMIQAGIERAKAGQLAPGVQPAPAQSAADRLRALKR